MGIMTENVSVTFMILFWAILASILFSLLCYKMQKEQKVEKAAKPASGFAAPSLVLAPLLLIICYQNFKLNLIFPPALLTSPSVIFLFCLAPASILFFASGLFFRIKNLVFIEYHHYSRQHFSQVARCFGLNPKKKLKKLILLKALTGSWAQSLPFFFGELIVVEAVFNAPGLGQNIFALARTRQHEALFSYLLLLILLYFTLFGFIRYLSGWLGVRLASYD